MRLSILASALSLVVATPALAAPVCAPLKIALTAATRTAEAKRITAAGAFKVKPADVSYILAEGAWRLVWATPAEAERGVFFFRKGTSGYRLVDTWGGVLAPDERGTAAAWARKLKGGVSPRLAQCFEASLTAGN